MKENGRINWLTFSIWNICSCNRLQNTAKNEHFQHHFTENHHWFVVAMRILDWFQAEHKPIYIGLQTLNTEHYTLSCWCSCTLQWSHPWIYEITSIGNVIWSTSIFFLACIVITVKSFNLVIVTILAFFRFRNWQNCLVNQCFSGVCVAQFYFFYKKWWNYKLCNEFYCHLLQLCWKNCVSALNTQRRCANILMTSNTMNFQPISTCPAITATKIPTMNYWLTFQVFNYCYATQFMAPPKKLAIFQFYIWTSNCSPWSGSSRFSCSFFQIPNSTKIFVHIHFDLKIPKFKILLLEI